MRTFMETIEVRLLTCAGWAVFLVPVEMNGDSFEAEAVLQSVFTVEGPYLGSL